MTTYVDTGNCPHDVATYHTAKPRKTTAPTGGRRHATANAASTMSVGNSDITKCTNRSPVPCASRKAPNAKMLRNAANASPMIRGDQ